MGRGKEGVRLLVFALNEIKIEMQIKPELTSKKEKKKRKKENPDKILSLIFT